MLIEASPVSFQQLLRNRPSSLNLRLAACAKPGSVVLSRHGTAGRAVDVRSSDVAGADAVHQLASNMNRVFNVSCAPIGQSIAQLGVTRIDFFSLDVAAQQVESALLRCQQLAGLPP